MIKQVVLMLFILILFLPTYSQDKELASAEKLRRGMEIIADARKAVGIDKADIKSFHFKSKTLSTTKNEAAAKSLSLITTYEVNAAMPDKIQLISLSEAPAVFKNTSVWNGIKYKKISEFDFMGERKVEDITNSSLNAENLKTLEGRIGKDKVEALKKAGKRDPKESLNNEIWTELFPLILSHPFEQGLEFNYVGRAESANRTANVVDVKPKNGKSYRLFFDSETNYLLMMIESYKVSGDFGGAFDGDYEVKYYYSNRELIDNVLIPRKIKVEQKVVSAGKEPRIGYRNIDVLEFNLNPEFKKNMFEIK